MSYQGVSLGINFQGLYSIIIVCIHILILHAQPDVLGRDLSSGNKKGLVALHLLCRNKEKDILELLVEKLTSWEVIH